MKRYGMPAQLKNGLVLHLPGVVSGTTAYDFSGNGNDGTLVNSPGTQRSFGYKGFTFNGTNQYVTCPDANSLDLTTSYTLATVLDMDSLPSSGNLYSLFQKGPASNTSFEFELWNNSGTQTIFVSHGDGPTQDTYSITYSLPTSKRVSLMAAYGLNNVKFYANGVEIGSVNTSRSPAANSAPLLLGMNGVTGGRYFSGKRYNDAVWNRKLSETEARLYHETQFIP